MTTNVQLRTINSMLAMIGEAPVAAIDSVNSDAVIARDTLAEVSRDVQIRGWTFNTDYNVKLLPAEATGFILLPLGVLNVDGYGYDWHRDVTDRGGKLYDRENQTFVFDSPVIVKMVVELDFNDLPAVARSYIKMKASRIFQQRVVGSETLSSFSQMDEAQSWSLLLDQDLENEDAHVTAGTRSLGIGGSSWL